MGADQLDRPERILLRGRITVRRNPIAQNEGPESEFSETFCNRLPFGRFTDISVAASGNHQQCRFFSGIGVRIAVEAGLYRGIPPEGKLYAFHNHTTFSRL